MSDIAHDDAHATHNPLAWKAEEFTALALALALQRQLVERELKRARIVGMSSPGRQTRLSEDLPPLLLVGGQAVTLCCGKLVLRDGEVIFAFRDAPRGGIAEGCLALLQIPRCGVQ